MALYFASQGAGRMVLPVLAGTVRVSSWWWRAARSWWRSAAPCGRYLR
jgi:hypothetical protein